MSIELTIPDRVAVIFVGYETLYEGSEREHVCDRLTPGQMYMVRVACCNVAGRSEVRVIWK